MASHHRERVSWELSLARLCEQRQWARTAIIVAALSISAGSQTAPMGRGRTPAPVSPGQFTVTVHQLRAPSKARSEIEKANKALAKNDVEEANRHLSQALAAYPNYSVALTIRAVVELNAGKAEQAAADLENAVNADPEYGTPYVVLASVLNDAKRYDDALIILQQGRRLLPNAWQTHLEIGRALYGKGDDRGALQAVTAALRLAVSTETAEDLAIIHFYRAAVLVQLKDIPGARLEYEEVVKADPEGEYSAFSRRALDLLQHPPVR